MKGVVFLGDRKLDLMDFPDPTPGPDEVVLEIRASGMCGSDLKYYRAPPGGGAAPGPPRRRNPSTISSVPRARSTRPPTSSPAAMRPSMSTRIPASASSATGMP